ncbi:MAG: hypothetical protein GOV02_03560 [Candidatus Aenigmarchaeota archaeon]|nr:hypothetical protein [Candidatus Aenigmarchaeota archaeon]
MKKDFSSFTAIPDRKGRILIPSILRKKYPLTKLVVTIEVEKFKCPKKQLRSD